MSSSDPSRPVHRRAVSSPHYPTRHTQVSQEKTHIIPPMASGSEHPSTSQRPRAASRIMYSVKRSLTPSSVPKKRSPEYSKSGMHSTFEESNPSPSPQQFRQPDPAASRPTIEQIAMGLHISRTPHLRPLASSPYAFSQRNSAPHSTKPYEHHHRSTPVILPPPPSRSSMKKPSTTLTSSSSSPAVTPFSSASASSTTMTSVAPSTSQNARSFAAIKFRMARLLPYARSVSAPTSVLSSPAGSPPPSVSEHAQPKKAVRFTSGEVEDWE